ncbi:MAG: hypothetical protein WD184_05480 [Acidimicrobiia bacterium]
MAEAGRSYESADAPPERRVALLLVHGMGEQQPHQLTDLFAVELSRVHRRRGNQVELRHRVVASEGHRASQSYVEVKITPKSRTARQPDTTIDLHEVYWADRPQGLIKLKEVGRWLFTTSLAPLLRWSLHAASHYRWPRDADRELPTAAPPAAAPAQEYEYSPRAGVAGFLREVLLALALPVLGLVLFMLAANAATHVDNYLKGLGTDFREIDAAWTDFALLAMFTVLSAASLFMAFGGYRAWRLGAIECDFVGAEPTPRTEDRWRYLRRWAAGSWATGLLLLAGAFALYRDPEVQELVAAVLRMGEDPAWQLLAAAAGLVGGIVLWWYLVGQVWRIPWRPLAVVRVVAAAILIGGTVVGGWLGYQALPEEWVHPVRLVFWLATVAGASKLTLFLIGWIGDVAIYFGGLDTRSRHHTVREEILHLVTARLVALAELLKGLPPKSPRRKDTRKPYYDEVLVAAHSLGSVIAYDAINRLAVEQRSDSDGDEFRMAREDFDRIKGLFSFGSPLDKVVYFFQRTGDVSEPVRAQIVSSLISLRRHSTGRPYGNFKIEDYHAIQPAGFRWHNAWSWGDVLGHRLDHFQIDKGKQFHFDYLPLVAHTRFWKDPDFYQRVAEWIDDEPSQPMISAASEIARTNPNAVVPMSPA